jgi:hypothetical protein
VFVLPVPLQAKTVYSPRVSPVFFAFTTLHSKPSEQPEGDGSETPSIIIFEEEDNLITLF